MEEKDLELTLFDRLSIENDKNSMFRRYFITWNNPFWTGQFEEVDVNNTTLPLQLDRYDLSILKSDDFKNYFEFRFIKIHDVKTNEDVVVERPFAVDDGALQEYITCLKNFKYTAFQVERGEESGIEHIQGMLIFKNPVRFTTMCLYFPLADISKIKGTNNGVRRYCTKEDTRIRGPYVVGDFAEERERTDVKEFIDMLDCGASDADLKQSFPNLYLRELNKIDKLREEKRYEKYANETREVKVTYVYGPPGTGKSTWFYDKHNFNDVFSVSTYDNSAFTNYRGQPVLLLDEYAGQIDLQTLNKYLDRWPVELRGLNVSKQACYTEVCIISNYAPNQLYTELQSTRPDVYKSFLRRLGTIIRFDSFCVFRTEKEPVSSVQQSITVVPIQDDYLDEIF